MASIEELARAADFSSTRCGHQTSVSVSCLKNGEVVLLCDDCYQQSVEEDYMHRISIAPLDGTLECYLCHTHSNVRRSVEIPYPMCDSCALTSLKRLAQSMKYPFTSRRVNDPNEVAPGQLFVGPKETAMKRDILTRLNIVRVLICCEAIPAYHKDDPTMIYHRIPVQDTNIDEISRYLPSALAFIAQGVLRGERCLVHCNAGISRSGSVAVEWIRRTAGVPLGEALVRARKGRHDITPNRNFMRQLAMLPDPIVLRAPPVDEAARMAEEQTRRDAMHDMV
jgi:hypothetical protein